MKTKLPTCKWCGCDVYYSIAKNNFYCTSDKCKSGQGFSYYKVMRSRLSLSDINDGKIYQYHTDLPYVLIKELEISNWAIKL